MFDRIKMGKESLTSPSMERLARALAQLPGIGRRTAERLAFHLLKAPKADALELADAIREVKEKARHCSCCFHLSEDDPCAICTDQQRDRGCILVVEQSRDVVLLERSGAYRGLYHVLMGQVSPLEGIGPDHLTLKALEKRVRKALAEGGPLEVILGTSPTLNGDGTAMVIAERLARLEGLRLTRLGRGLPTGSQMEFAQPAVLADALGGRREMAAEERKPGA